jgi:cation diffusion facilitator family transporter
MYLVVGSSQAMKSAWLEDALGMFPSISFLIASKIYHRSPTEKFPYGYHRAFGMAYFAGAIFLFFMGAFLAIDSAITLLQGEHPTIGSTMILGKQVWLGWIMILVLLYSAVPAMLLGRKKLPIAKDLHNKILYTDANTQKADYMTAFAAIIGIIGVGYGLWWADAVAALFISASVLRDGAKNLRNSVKDLADRRPIHVHNQEKDELIDQVEQLVRSWDWVEDAYVRFREHGQVCFGEIYIVVRSTHDLPGQIEKGVKIIKAYHWRLHDVVIMPVLSLPG